MYGAVFEEGELLYSKRYSHRKSIEKLLQRSITEAEMEETEKALAQFKKRLQKERVYIQLPERQKKGNRFIAIAKEFSKRYQVDIDIKRKSFFIEVSLHLYCATYPANMTHRLSELLRLVCFVSA